MSKQMQDDLFDYILAHALGDVCEDEVRRANEIAAEVTFSEKFNQFFKRLIAKRKREKFVRSTPRYTKRILLSFCAMFSAISLALFTQGPVQAAVKSVFYEWTHAFVEYEVNDVVASGQTYSGIRLTYVPTGFEMDKAVIRPTSFSTISFWNPNSIDNEPPAFEIVCASTENQLSGGIDNEHGVETSLNISNAADVLFIQSNNPLYPSHLTWVMDGFFYQLDCPHAFTSDEIKKIAEGIKILF